jgi:hypothetical protein
MLLLAESVNLALAEEGQLHVPFEAMGYQWTVLEQLFVSAIRDYEEQRPAERKEVLYLTPEGIDLPLAKHVRSIKVYAGETAAELVTPYEFRNYKFFDGKLSCITYGNFLVDYLAKYDLKNYPAQYTQAQIVTAEASIKFKLKGHFKKGTLNISATSGSSSYSLEEDLTSYLPSTATFTVDATTNQLIVNSTFGQDLLTGSAVNFTTTGTLPAPLFINEKFYIIRVPDSDTNFKLASTISNALAGTGIDLTTTGTGVHTVRTFNNLPEVSLVGNMGTGTVNLETLEVNITLAVNFSADLIIQFTSLYKAVKELSDSDKLLFKLFKSKIMQAIGNSKLILKTEGLPFDFSIDDLYTKGEALKEKAEEELLARNKWWLWR